MAHLLPLLLCLALPLSAADNMEAFPPAEKGMTRHVLHLPEEADETALQVQLLVGKTVETDGVNRHFFSGSLETRTIEGWGFTYHHLAKLGPMAGTLMAVEPDAPLKKRFVSVGGDPFLVRYNSRLPLVVYLPEGAEVRYRIWRADAEFEPIPAS